MPTCEPLLVLKSFPAGSWCLPPREPKGPDLADARRWRMLDGARMGSIGLSCAPVRLLRRVKVEPNIGLDYGYIEVAHGFVARRDVAAAYLGKVVTARSRKSRIIDSRDLPAHLTQIGLASAMGELHGIF